MTLNERRNKMTETLEQIRKLIVDGKFLEALNMIDLIMANSPQLENKLCICHPTIPPTFEEENKELVSKYNQLEKEKMAQDDTIHELLQERTELTIENLQLLNQIANASKKVERDADDSKTMENLRKMLEDECSRRCELEEKLEIACKLLNKYRLNTDTICPKIFLEQIEEVK